MSIIGGALSNSAGRSRKGAWIEILMYLGEFDERSVAPARERGLKSLCKLMSHAKMRRSRKGAWIEIFWL